jgi:hypothetical protein
MRLAPSAPDVYRRTLLGACGSLAALGGCQTLRGLDAAAAGRAGAIVVRNDDDRLHRVTVTVERVSDDPDDVPPANSGRTPGDDAVVGGERTFEVPAGETVRAPAFVTEPGAYFVTASVTGGAMANEWFGLSEGATGGVTGRRIEVYVGRDGGVTVATPAAA